MAFFDSNISSISRIISTYRGYTASTIICLYILSYHRIPNLFDTMRGNTILANQQEYRFTDTEMPMCIFFIECSLDLTAIFATVFNGHCQTNIVYSIGIINKPKFYMEYLPCSIAVNDNSSAIFTKVQFSRSKYVSSKTWTCLCLWLFANFVTTRMFKIAFHFYHRHEFMLYFCQN